jgi:hypothetical protein
MKPRDSLGPTDADRYDEACDSGEDSDSDFDFDDQVKFMLDIQEEGLSDEQILTYSLEKLYPSSYVLMIYFQAFNRDGFCCVIPGTPLAYPQRPDKSV